MTSRSFSITIKTPSGNSFKMEVFMHDSIRSIKNKIEQQHGYCSKGSKLIFAGKILEDDMTILDYNVSKNCVILFIMSGSLSAKSKEEQEFHQKLLSIKSMKKQLRAAYCTPTDETFMDILDVKDDNDTKSLQKWCQDNEYDSDALFYDLMDSSIYIDSNVYQFMHNAKKKPKKIYSLKTHIMKHYQDNEDMTEVDDDEKSEYQYKRKYDKLPVNDTKGWDNNLNEGITSTFEGDEKQMFEDMFKSFESKTKDKLRQHLKLKRDINALFIDKTDEKDEMKYSGNKEEIENYLKQMMEGRRHEITSIHKTRVYQMRKQRKALDNCWKRAHTLPNIPKPKKKYAGGIFGMLYDNLNDSNYYGSITNQKEIDGAKRKRKKKELEINKEMTRREKCANIELQRLELGYYKQKQNIDRMEQLQIEKLNECDDIKQWQQEFEDMDLREEKNNTLVEMIENKIRSTHSKIIFGKYLQNSPFANDMQEEAKVSDHEITKIAKLAGSTLLIDMVNRDIAKHVTNEDEKKDTQSVDDELLQFELRLDDDWSNWNETRKLQLQKELAQKFDVDASTLQFVSAREGCIIVNFTQKMQNVRGDTGINFQFAHIDPKALHDDIYAYNKDWEDNVNGCLDYIRKKIANLAEINEEALYVSQKCVAIIVSHHSQDHTQNVLDSNFLTSDLDKGLYKEIMNPKWDRAYGQGKDKTHWTGKLRDGRSRGGDKYPYYCPSGWKRYAVKVDGDFDQKYGNWPICYHGSETCAIGSILSHGIYGNWPGTTNLRFFSPSIVYSAHPRYARPKLMNDRQQYVQMIFQCRVDPNAMYKCGETLRIGRSTKIDSNFSMNFQKCRCGFKNPKWGYSCNVDGHNEMEWFLDITDADKYVIYGIMLRFSNDPSILPESSWWRGHWKTDWKGK